MRKEIGRWMKLAEDDLEKAKILFDAGKYDGTVFYSQQAAEKAFKALLIKKTENYPKIHDLTRLARLSESTPRIIELSAKINPAYTASRYPDSPKEYSKKESDEILKSSKEVLKWIKENL